MGFLFLFFLPFLWKDVDKLTCVVTETNYILASPSSQYTKQVDAW